MYMLICGINAVDVLSGSIKSNTNLLIQGTRIVDYIHDKEAFISDNPNTKILNCEGQYAMPGLIDLHVHLIWSAGLDPAETVKDEGIQLSLLRSAHNAYQNLKAGVTTVRDLGSNKNTAISLSRAINKGYIQGSRVIASGMTIIMTGGHDPFWGIEADGVDEVIKAVRKQVFAGAKVIKASATGGVYGRPEGEDVENTELSFEELEAIVKESHRFGLKVAAHAISKAGIENCINAGIDTIEHGHFLSDKLINQMVDKGLAWVPTLYTYKQIAEGRNVPSYASAKAKQIVAKHKEAFELAISKDVLIGAGSDAGSPNLPHPALIEELECMVSYGANYLKALQTATINAAKTLGLEESIGSLDKDKLADIVITPENPLDNISNLREVTHVIKDGKLVV